MGGGGGFHHPPYLNGPACSFHWDKIEGKGHATAVALEYLWNATSQQKDEYMPREEGVLLCVGIISCALCLFSFSSPDPEMPHAAFRMAPTGTPHCLLMS